MADAKIYHHLNPILRRIAEYYERAQTMDWVRDKEAWALYQTWRDVDSGALRPEKREEAAHDPPADP
jgi:hypothetical protein